jgi:arabinogalactan oligomer/maltooligosaccharide transport system substrate-binding protein
MLKKSLSFIAGVVLLLAGCTPPATAVTIKVWQPAQEQSLLIAQTLEFERLNPQWNITWDLGVVEEPDVLNALTVDVEAGADVFAFPDDQLIGLVKAGAISEVQQFKNEVTERNLAWTIGASTYQNKLYAYPETADNGYFLYYNSSKLTATDVLKLDDILAKTTNSSKIMLDPMGGWGSATWFLANGKPTYDGETQTLPWSDAAGLASAQGMLNAYKTGKVLTGGNHAQLFSTGAIIATLTGTWEANNIKTALGANYAATKLPTFTNGLNQQQQMGSFTGAKLVGVNAFTEFPEAAHAFANFITNQDNQTARGLIRGLGPSNIAAASNIRLGENKALAALAAQAPYGVQQSTAVGLTYFQAMGAFSTAITTDTFPAGVTTLQALLNLLVTQATA